MVMDEKDKLVIPKEFQEFLETDCSYSDIKALPNGRYVAILPLMFTHAIIMGRIEDRAGYDDRWCYHDYQTAKSALDAWFGEEEPKGWHRHPATGRRRENGDPTIQHIQF